MSRNNRKQDGFWIETLKGSTASSDTDRRLDQAVELWRATALLPEGVIVERRPQILAVAVSEAGDDVVGIATTFLGAPAKLAIPLWMFRVFVDSQFRQQNVAFHLLHHAIDFHRKQFESGEDRRGFGLYTEVENPLIKTHRNEALWPTTKMSFVGYNQNGDHCRVVYFPDARLPQFPVA